jgi:hypothetical protein
VPELTPIQNSAFRYEANSLSKFATSFPKIKVPEAKTLCTALLISALIKLFSIEGFEQKIEVEFNL